MNAETSRATAEAEVRELVDRWLEAVLALDVDAIASHYASDIVAFDAVAQLRFKGVEAYKKHWQACLAMCPPGTMIFELRDLEITAGADLAFGHALTRCGNKDESGKEKASWMRMTACYRKTNGKWRIAHEHFSAPFDMASGKALFELVP